MSTKSHGKRDDLQCWRALSILAVLLFHIWPETFPNGFLGVDIFFLLSGYLMASLYSFENNILKSTINFYYRRIKRILPIYIFVIFFTLILLAKNVFPEEYKLILKDSKWAIFLATNYEDLLKQRGYFETESNYRFFRHCWSLAVEMQFYLIFPFIAIIRNKLTPRKYQLLLIVILIVSLVYQIMTPNKIMQYESLFCRIWQFSLGMLAQTFPTIFSNTKWPNSLMRILIFLTITTLIWPHILPTIFTCFIVLSFVAIIVSFSTYQNDPFKSFKIPIKIMDKIVKLGDISYILYLIHWPLITYFRISSISKSFNFYDGFLLFILSIIISKIAHEFLEKPLIKLCDSYRNLIIILSILYTSTIILPTSLTPISLKSQITSKLTLQVWENSLNFDAPLFLPPKWSTKNDIEFATKLRGEHMGGAFKCIEKHKIYLKKDGKEILYCGVNGKNSNGNLTALIIGNSFSMNIVAAVAANPLFKKVINGFVNTEQFPIRNEFEKYVLEKMIKKIKPDVTFVVQRYFQNELYETPIGKIKESKEFQHWNYVFKIIQNYTSAIILNKEQMVFPYDISREYVRRKFYNMPIDMKLKNPPKSEIMEEWFKTLECPKCEWFDYREAFCDKEFCNVIDNATGLPIFRDTEHISIIGLRKLKPFMDAVIEKALNSKNDLTSHEIIMDQGFDEIFNLKNPPKNMVILSSTINPRYLFALPFTIMSWKKLGVYPIVLLVGQKSAFNSNKQSRKTIKFLQEMKTYIQFIEPEKLSPTSMSQISRLFGGMLPFSTAFKSNETILITSDADLIVFHLNNHIPNISEGKTLHLYNSKCCRPVLIPPKRGNYKVPMYPMGTIGATIQTWREIMGIKKFPLTVNEIEDYVITEFGENFFHPNDDKNPRLIGSAIWYADQSLISYKIKEWLKIPKSILFKSEHTAPPRRIDRSKWPKPEQFKNTDIQNLDDCHLPRNVYTNSEWKKFKPFLEFAFNNDLALIKKFVEYREDFINEKN